MSKQSIETTNLQPFSGKILVVKCGGNSIAEDAGFLPSIAQQLKLLQDNDVRIILVHGGAPQIEAALKAQNIEPKKNPDGRRITDAATMDITAQALGQLSDTVVTALRAAGCRTKRLATPVTAEPFTQDSDRTGRVTAVNRSALTTALQASKIIVLNSVGLGEDALKYNINADDYAQAVAEQLRAHRLILATNVAGVWGADKQPIPLLTPSLSHQLIQAGAIKDGMIPKVESAFHALNNGVGGVAIIDGHRPNALLAALTDPQQVGTLFINPETENTKAIAS